MSPTVLQLQHFPILVRGVGELMVKDMKQDKNYTLLLMSLPLSTRISQAGSVIGSLNHDLINVGDSAQFCTGQNEVLLLKCT